METMSKIGEKAERIGISGPVFTLGTANSACSAAFYARISGIRANPLKYTDPDGTHDEVSILISFRSMPLGIIGNYRAADTHDNISKGIFFANQMSDIITTYSPDILRRNIIRQGERPNRGDGAHHINHAENGLFLSRGEHEKTFSSDYINRISGLLRDADTVGTQSTVLNTLQYIKNKYHK
jgi:hypothetical protein